MGQWQTIPLGQLELLIQFANVHDRPVTIDWVNRTIRVLSEVKTNPNVILSDGPMTYRDIYLNVSGQSDGEYTTCPTINSTSTH